ncbi:hypothetical protein [uncultured Microbacterium sp.]|uniref:hypothetical protein n=1 Tax=uncultured Microbacterium sp. TaxID=191216 RepID=UPI00261CA767|nr:hypothetical protein [uncultured Microbacterium sp.]
MKDGVHYAIGPDVAWIQASDHGGTPHLVWAAQLETTVQYEFTDTAWLVWMLLSDGISTAADIQLELQRIHAELGDEAARPLFPDAALQGFLDALSRDGLLRASRPEI